MSDMKIKVILEEANVNKDFFTSNRKENKLKCPFCQQELLLSSFRDGDEEHQMWNCLSCQLSAQRKLWQELIRTRKALDVATEFIKGISQTVINDCDNQYIVLGNFKKFAQDTLEQITALEQKGVK